MKNILVSVDFEKDATRLINQAGLLAKAFGAKVWVVHIAAPNHDFAGYETSPQFMRDLRAKDYREEHIKLQQLTDLLSNNGIEHEGLLIQGATVETILNETLKLQADLIIIGYNEHGFFHRIFDENTTAEVIRRSEIPVLVVPLEKHD